MTLHSITNTASFKLSALYLALFLVSFLAIGGTVYVLTTHTLEQQLKSTIEIETNRLKAEYDADGIDALKEEITENEYRTSNLYGILDQNGTLMAGSFGAFKPSAGWQIVMRQFGFTKSRQDEDPAMIYMKIIPLMSDVWLGVGHDGEYIQDAGEAIIQAFLWGIILVLALGVSGGFYMSRSFLNKIQNITTSAEAIIAGDLKRRLPVSKKTDELDKLAQLINEMLNKIGSLIENIQQVSNDVAHDLRTPIGHLKLRLEDALSKKLSPQQYAKRITFAIEEVDAILDTFSAMLRISQIESGSRRSGFKTVKFNDIVASVIDALKPVAEEQEKSFDVAIENRIQLTGDKELLTQLVFNLLDNAILHTPDHTKIMVDLRRTGAQIKLTVADNGPGIPEAYRQKVVQRFYRLEQSRTTPGNGLGLSIAAAIADLHEGTLNLLDNNPGLKIVLSLPDHV